MRWILASIAAIAITIAGAAWVGQPSPLTIEIPDFGVTDDLNMDRIARHIETLSATPSRMSGYPGADAAFAHIRRELERIGLTEFFVQEFPVAAPIVEHAWLEAEMPEGRVRIPLHPLWPNLVRTSHTPGEGVRGPLVDAGRGTEPEIHGKTIRDAIVVMNWDSDTEWLSVLEFGGKAVLFREDDRGTGYQARKKFLTVPANLPRFFVAAPDLAALDALLATPDTEAVIHCVMDWQQVTARNLLARLSPGAPPGRVPDLDRTPIIFHAYYDSISTVPDLAPGAEQSCGPAVLLELARYIRDLPEIPPRPIYLLFTGGHGQAMAGMMHFTRTLMDGLENGWPAAERDSLIAQMGRPGLFIGLDLSSRSDRMGIFCVGRFRSQFEHILRPKFSTLALKLDDFAKSFMTNYEEVTVHTITPFVDGINMTLGRGWWTYFPYQAPFASELPTLAGMPGVTLSTINDDRRFVDTPGDTTDRMRLDLLAQQLLHVPGERVGLAKIALALAYWKGPFVSSPLENKVARVQGRVVWLDQQRDYTPNRPLQGAAVTYKTYRADKHLMGLRGVPLVLTDAEGRYSFDGLMQSTVHLPSSVLYLEAYGLASQRFLAENPDAEREYLAVLARGGAPSDAIAVDGSTIFGIDRARPDDYPSTILPVQRVEHCNLVTFPCKAVTLSGLTEPRGFLSLTDITVLDVSTESPPFQWGGSYSDSWRGDPEENCISIWADPTLRVRLTLGFGFLEKRLILINNSAENPVGTGYVLAELETIPSWVLHGARGMWFLNEDRIRNFERHGINNPRVRTIHEEARHYLDLAEKALETEDYQTYRVAAERGWALESRAYSELLNTANNMIRGVLFYLLLLLPFAYCLERLVLNSGTIRGRIIGMLLIFAGSFIVVALMHPAFRFTLTPVLVLIAFIILALAIAVIALVLGHFDTMLRERKQAVVGVHEDTVALGNVAMRAVDLGIANIRRRPQRGFLTGLTIVLVTFTLLSFTSVVPEVGISRLRHPEGEPVYRGLLTRDRAWQPLPAPLYASMQRSFGDEAPEAVRSGETTMAGRAWYFSDYSGHLSRIDLNAVATETPGSGPDGETTGRFTAVALVGMEPNEARITAVADTLVAGRWFETPDEVGLILPLHAAKNLGIGLEDLGRRVMIFGQELPVIGIYDQTKFDALRDLDGEPLSPVNFVQQMLMDAQRTTDEVVDTLKQYIHWSSDQMAIVPYQWARGIGATVRSIAVRVGDDVSPGEEAEAWTRRSNLTILASDGDLVTL